MSDEHDTADLCMVGCFCLMIGLGIGGCAGLMRASNLKADAVEHGAAEYNSKTGEWGWKVQPESKEKQ